jgi:DsbC/DsbD-like thiol-disulfide interchange protein
MRPALLALFTLACGGSPAVRTAPAAPGEAVDEAAVAPVAMTIIPGTSHAMPGEPIEFGVRFDLPEGWHIYWVNPGDSGMATELRVDGAAFRPVEWPCPQAIPTESGVSWGYEGSVTAIVRGEATSAGTFTAHARWLVCKDACIPGEGTAKVFVAAGAPAPTGLLDDAKAALPRPRDELRALEVAWTPDREDGDLEVTLRVPGATRVEFFPLPDAPLLYRTQTSLYGATTVHFARPGKTPPGGPIAGLLRVDDQSYEIRFETPQPHAD